MIIAECAHGNVAMRLSIVRQVIPIAIVCVGGPDALAQSHGVKTLHVFLATQKGGKAVTTFSADVPTIYAFWKGESLNIGDAIRVLWIAEDVGEGAGAKETEIRSAQAKIYKSDADGSFTLSRPEGKNWPVGKYRVQFYVNGSMAEVLKFTIKAGATVEVH